MHQGSYDISISFSVGQFVLKLQVSFQENCVFFSSLELLIKSRIYAYCKYISKFRDPTLYFFHPCWTVLGYIFRSRMVNLMIIFAFTFCIFPGLESDYRSNSNENLWEYVIGTMCPFTSSKMTITVSFLNFILFLN
jgi:hypothetical protein